MNAQTNFLAEIVERKRARCIRSRAEISTERLRSIALKARQGAHDHALRRALEANQDLKVIAEIKRASPSKGAIRNNVVPEELALAYFRGGAAAISVLTEEYYFHGSLDDLRAVREAVPLPILRKDFIIDEFQLFETAEAGADALLLIAAILNDDQLSLYRRITEDELGMDALVEVHSLDEMRRAKRCGATLIGVNNRNLSTFEVSLDISLGLARETPAEAILISESGLNSGEDLRRLRAWGYRGFLIGEHLMRAADPSAALQSLIRSADRNTPVLVKICGVTNLQDARVCVDAGADILGFNFYSGSPRYIAPEKARRIIEQLPSGIQSVGVFVNEETPRRVASIGDVAGVSAVQLHGDETPSYCRELKDRRVIKAVRVDTEFSPQQITPYQTEAILLDAFSPSARGGTGKCFDWAIAKQARGFVSRLFLAGGLTPENVTQAVATVEPYAVDVCSSVEHSPGQKDEARVREFITAAKRAASERSVSK